MTDQALIELGQSLRQSRSRLVGLGLSDTDITDRGIQALSGSFIMGLDLRRTAVTAAGISQLKTGRPTIYVGFDQFTTQQLEMLRQHHLIDISAPSWGQ